MKISTSLFVTSNTDVKKCPPPVMPEYGFIGRSNVGKSSLINMLCGNRKLAKTSSTPGKTQLINHFIINENWYLVDLPGYGYAKVSKDKKINWETFIIDYLLKRENLMCVFVLVDSRLEIQKIDAEFMRWLGEKQVPFVIVFTKTDKLTKKQSKNNIDSYKKELQKEWEELPTMFFTSAEKKHGKEEILSFISENNKAFVKP